jgi:hypothetical protein
MINFLKYCILNLLILILFYSCQDTNNKKDINIEPENLEQKLFSNLITQSCNDFRYYTNDIQKREFFNKYDERLNKLSDSLEFFNNWKGQISDIKISDKSNENMVELNIELEVRLSEYQKITFHSRKYFSNKNLDSNLIYRQLKILNKGTIVYFDGFIAKNSENKIDYNILYNHEDREKVCNPYLEFYFVSISEKIFEFKNKDDFNKIQSIQSNIWKSMNNLVENKITERQFRANINIYKKQLDLIIPSLNYQEKSYIESFTRCLAMQFLAN